MLFLLHLICAARCLHTSQETSRLLQNWLNKTIAHRHKPVCQFQVAFRSLILAPTCKAVAWYAPSARMDAFRYPSSMPSTASGGPPPENGAGPVADDDDNDDDDAPEADGGAGPSGSGHEFFKHSCVCGIFLHSSIRISAGRQDLPLLLQDPSGSICDFLFSASYNAFLPARRFHCSSLPLQP